MNKVTDRIIGELYVGSWHLPDFVGLGYFIEYREFIDETNTIRKEIEDAQSCYLTTTNNRAELLAVIYGLQSVIDNITSQKIKLDQIDFYTTFLFFLFCVISIYRMIVATKKV